MSTFVTVGNATQPFPRLIAAVLENLPLLPKPVFIQHGVSKLPPGEYASQAFIPMQEFDERIRSATLVVTHGGAGSLIHAIRAGRRPVVVPREARFGEIVDDHQAELAKAFAEAGRISLVTDAEKMSAAIELSLQERGNVPSAGAIPPLAKMIEEALRRAVVSRARP